MRFEDEQAEVEREETLFTYKQFKANLREFMELKKVIAVDLTEEYSKKLRKLEQNPNLIDLKAQLLKTIQEYEDLLRAADDEQ